jgi:hypothetical protein
MVDNRVGMREAVEEVQQQAALLPPQLKDHLGLAFQGILAELERVRAAANAIQQILHALEQTAERVKKKQDENFTHFAP